MVWGARVSLSKLELPACGMTGICLESVILQEDSLH